MIRLEDLRNAIDAVSEQDPEIGYGLRELMSAGRIGLPLDVDNRSADPCFLFEGERVWIRKVSFFNHGTVPVEERLVLKYGQAVEKHRIQETGGPRDYFAAARWIQNAGIERLVSFELQRAIARLQHLCSRQDGSRSAVQAREARLEKLTQLQQQAASRSREVLQANRFLYSAQLQGKMEARFLQFPFTVESLRQVAEMNLEFFHLRFVLDLFINGTFPRLYASMCRGRLTGLMFLVEKKRLFYSGLEVHYVATINGVPLDAETVDYPRIRGAGTFLMAGAWLVWKEFYPKAVEVLLDAELGAGRFYENVGFAFRPPYGYVLKKPGGRLLLLVLAMAMNRPGMPEGLQKEVAACIRRQIRYLQKSRPADDPDRKTAILAVSTCIQDRANQDLAEIARGLLYQYRGKIPESQVLLDSLVTTDQGGAQQVLLKGASMVLVVCDPVYEQHLEGIFHLESRKRVQALETILAGEPFPDRIIRIAPRAATEEQLAWVHRPEYIARIADTAGSRLCSLDPDTQTTAQSYATARLAVGGVFSLIDAVWNEKAWHCGMACVRPPGHHAEADRAMGFCLFNNVAMGAEYLRRVHGAERVLIVDVDVHHGNGIQQAFYDRSDVLYFSIHQFPCYPGTGKLSEIGAGAGEGYTINVPLSRGKGNHDYAKILHFLLSPVARQYRPDMIIVALGFDLYQHDPLGQMNVTPDGYALIVHMLKKIAGQVCGGRIVFVLEGGYSLEGIRTCGLRVFQELADLPTLAPDTIDNAVSGRFHGLPELKKVMEVQKKYWPSLL